MSKKGIFIKNGIIYTVIIEDDGKVSISYSDAQGQRHNADFTPQGEYLNLTPCDTKDDSITCAHTDLWRMFEGQMKAKLLAQEGDSSHSYDL